MAAAVGAAGPSGRQESHRAALMPGEKAGPTIGETAAQPPFSRNACRLELVSWVREAGGASGNAPRGYILHWCFHVLHQHEIRN